MESFNPAPKESEKPRKFFPEITFTRVDSPDDAQIVFKSTKINFDPGQNLDLETTTLNQAKAESKSKFWFADPYWREMGEPAEQVDFIINNHRIILYNFNRELQVSDEHIAQAKRAFVELEQRFPGSLSQIKWILIPDKQQSSVYFDEDKFPLNGYALISQQAIKLQPRALQPIQFRVSAASNFEGTLVHEVGHFIGPNLFRDSFSKNFKWIDCSDFPGEWKREKNNSYGRFINVDTGEVAINFYYPDPKQTDQYLNDYTKIYIDEDICDSLVAYIFDPKLLQSVSPIKYSIFESTDKRKVSISDSTSLNSEDLVGISARRVPKEEISLPDNSNNVTYYVEEPKTIGNNSYESLSDRLKFK